jgi:hypothetical protein
VRGQKRTAADHEQGAPKAKRSGCRKSAANQNQPEELTPAKESTPARPKKRPAGASMDNKWGVRKRSSSHSKAPRVERRDSKSLPGLHEISEDEEVEEVEAHDDSGSEWSEGEAEVEREKRLDLSRKTRARMRQQDQAQEKARVDVQAMFKKHDVNDILKHVCGLPHATLSEFIAVLRSKRIPVEVKELYRQVGRTVFGDLSFSGDGNSVYGEMTQGILQAAFQRINPEGGLLLDIGHGRGLPSLQAAVGSNFTHSVGIELQKAFYKDSLENLQKVGSNDTTKAALKKCMFLEGDILDAQSLEPFTHVFSHCVGKSLAMLAIVQRVCSSL